MDGGDGAESGRRRSRGAAAAAAAAAALVVAVLGGCMPVDVQYLSDDARGGRVVDTVGSADARAHIVDSLSEQAPGLMGGVGDEQYLHRFDYFRFPTTYHGTNVVAIIEGTTLPDEHVVIGAHYDHVHRCTRSVPDDTVCNGATDNATGVAAVLDVARELAADPPPRSVVVALWDAEEDGQVGSKSFMRDEVLPPESIVAYVNLDIVGSNLLPSLRNTTYAVGAETGGPVLEAIVEATGDGTGFDLVHLSDVFAAETSDHWAFTRRDIPAVFLTDSAGSCFHDVADEERVVDYDKLERQARWAATLTRALATVGPTPTFAPGSDPTYRDATELLAMMERAVADLDRFTASQQARALENLAAVRAAVADGPEAFDYADQVALGRAARDSSNHVQSLPCDGFLLPGED